MSIGGSASTPDSQSRIRRDGWTPERQLRFLDALALTRSVTRAAAFAGMSRESAYRLRDRREGALFAAVWDRAMQGHNCFNFGPSARTRARRLEALQHCQSRDLSTDGKNGAFTTP